MLWKKKKTLRNRSTKSLLFQKKQFIYQFKKKIAQSNIYQYTMAVCQPTTTILSFFFVEVEVGVEVVGGAYFFGQVGGRFGE